MKSLEDIRKREAAAAKKAMGKSVPGGKIGF